VVASQLKSGIENSEATNVAGKNATVTAARVFIDEESRLLADASVLESFPSAMLSFESFWAMRLRSWFSSQFIFLLTLTAVGQV
jgi:hypothetical protein